MHPVPNKLLMVPLKAQFPHPSTMAGIRPQDQGSKKKIHWWTQKLYKSMTTFLKIFSYINQITDITDNTESDITDITSITESNINDTLDITQSSITDITSITESGINETFHTTECDITDTTDITECDITDTTDTTERYITDITDNTKNYIPDITYICRCMSREDLVRMKSLQLKLLTDMVDLSGQVKFVFTCQGR